MNRFVLSIELGNAEMRTHADIANALSDVIDALNRGRSGGYIRDVNGNHVGEYNILTDDDVGLAVHPTEGSRMTRKDFELIAGTLSGAPIAAWVFEGRDVREALAEHFALTLATTNPRFDRARFLAACGVKED